MLVRRFLAWSQTASAGDRAEATSALARAWLYGDLDADEQRLAEVALTTLLDDPSPLVRRALAEAVAGAADAPRHLALALANDQSDVSAIVLTRSLSLRDADLIDCAAVGDAFAQAAIALRPRLSASVAAAIAEIGAREALIALAVNAGAELAPFSIRRMIERFGEDGELREALLARADLPLGQRHDLAVAAAQALTAFVSAKGWLTGERAERVAREARDKAAVLIAAEAGEAQLQLARHLREAGRITPALLLRALLSGDRAFFAAALADLAATTEARVIGLMREPRGVGFGALIAKAGLPGALAPAFRAAAAATRGVAPNDGELSLDVVSAVIDACEDEAGEDLGKAIALLRRFEVEAARAQARRESALLLAPAAAPPVDALERAAAIEAPSAAMADEFEQSGAAIEAVVAPDPATIAEQDGPAPERRAA